MSLLPAYTLNPPATESLGPLYERRWFIWLVSFGLATIIVFTDTSQDYINMSMHRPEVPSLGRIMLWPAIWWYSWALIAPGIFLLTRRFSFSKENWKRTLLIQCAGCLAAYSIHLSIQVGSMVLPAFSTLHPTWEHAIIHHAITSIYINLLIYWCIVAFTHGLIYFIRYKQKELHTATLETELHKAQLLTLKSQLHPHFLFNTLNAVSTLMYRDVRAADRIVAQLGDLLRTTIDTTGINEVPLRDEVSFLQKYLAIEKTRFQDNLTIDIQIAPEVEMAMVPNLILQPLAENAVKHGVDGQSNRTQIAISAWKVNNTLCLRVADSGPGLSGGDGMIQKGTGLTNTLERLEKIYGANHEITFSPNLPHGLIVDICIPFASAPEPAENLQPA